MKPEPFEFAGTLTVDLSPDAYDVLAEEMAQAAQRQLFSMRAIVVFDSSALRVEGPLAYAIGVPEEPFVGVVEREESGKVWVQVELPQVTAGQLAEMVGAP